jgi:tRNA G18 (ribose-2'-O)-methylase SpoU
MGPIDDAAATASRTDPGIWVEHVDDADDPRLDDFRHLRDPELRRATEQRAYVAESPLVVRHLLRSGRPVRSVLVDERRLDRLAPELAGLAARAVPVRVVPPAVLAQVVGFDLHRGALAAGERWALPEPAALLARARIVLVLERVNDHENLGIALRTAAALGVDAVLLCPECSDPLYRRCLRVSIGHALTVPWTRLTPWPDGLAGLRAAGFTTLALTPERGAEPLRAVRPAPDERVAVLVGAEGPGLRPDVLDAADRRVRIPMVGDVDSLNVATAAAIALHHVVEAVRPTP